MKIRIGNDIKLNVYLSKKNIPDTVNIKSIRCVLVNTNTDQCCQCPSTAYDINGCGLPKYHILGHCHPNVCNNNLDFMHCDCHHSDNCFFDHNYYMAYPFNGFGVYPEWDNIYMHDRCHHFSNGYNCKVLATESPDRIEVLFPAIDQRQIGNYNLILTASIFEPGYNPDNTRVITVDYSSVFELVEYSNDADVNDSITISVGSPTSSDLQTVKIDNFNKPTIVVGDTQFLKAVITPDSPISKDLVWECNSSNIQLLNTTGDIIQYKALSIPNEKTGTYPVQISVYYKYNNQIKDTITINIINYIEDIVYGLSGDFYILPDSTNSISDQNSGTSVDEVVSSGQLDLTTFDTTLVTNKGNSVQVTTKNSLWNV